MILVKKQAPRWSALLVGLWSLFLFLTFSLTVSGSASGLVTPTVNMVPTPDRLQRPTLPAQPNQADLGSQVYYYVCMACHGDRGQGLSEEWIAAWELGKESCWQSRCHASNHPEEGFELPRSIPAVVGPHIAARFASAQELHDYLKAAMPWHAPGSLKDEEYWQLTAYLLRLNGFDPGDQVLQDGNAADFRLRPAVVASATPLPPPGREALPLRTGINPPWALFVAAGFLIGFLSWVVWRYNKGRR